MNTRHAQTFSLLAALCLASPAAGCVGAITDAGGAPPPDGECVGGACDPTVIDERGGCTGPACMPADCEGICIGASGLTRLTRAEYRNSVRDILGVAVDGTRLPPDHEILGTFASNEPQAITADDVDRYAAMAEDTAAAIDVAALTACLSDEAEDACAARFVGRIGERFYRRPLTDAERDEMTALYDWARSEGDGFDPAIRLVATSFLMAPSFLYRVEPVADTDAPALLDGYAVATRLSFFLWQTSPDEELLAAAAAGELDDPAGIERQARRLLADERADAALRTFHRRWLGIAEITNVIRDDERLTPEIRRSMRNETDAFAIHVFREGEGDLRTLLSADYSFVDDALAEFYGAESVGMAGMTQVAVPDRRGILTHGSVMAANAADSEADPVYRGKFIRTRVLCQTLGARPDGVDDAVMMREGSITDSMSERERLDILTSGAECQGCHYLMNGPGFAFSMYDSTGRFRVTDREGHDVDTSFELAGVGSAESDVNGTYDGALDLAGALAESEDVAQCVTAQWMRFALGRDTDEEGASFVQASEAFEASGRDLRELVVAITTTDAFRHRRLPTPRAGY